MDDKTQGIAAPFQERDDHQQHSERKRGVIRMMISAIVPLAVLIGAAFGVMVLMDTSPKANRRAPERMARLVEVEPVSIGTETIIVEAMGTVRAAREVTLQSRVGGHVTWVSDSWAPGGLLEAGAPILKLDPTDYTLVVRQREAAVNEALSELKIEKGQQTVAKREYEMLGKSLKDETKNLILRGPQLAAIEASVQSAEAALRQAQLDLSRTTVRTQFDAVIKDRSVDIGAQVSTTTALATVIGTETYWLEVAVPVDQLQWIDIPRSNGDIGSAVRIYNETAWGKDASRTGRVVRLASDLEVQGRMAKLLVAVNDPLSLKPQNSGAPLLLIGMYVRAELNGVRLGPSVLVARNLVRDDDTVWLMNADNSLEIRDVTIAYRGKDRVVLDDGLTKGEHIVKTDLTTPVAGMPLRLSGTNERQGKGRGQGRTVQ